MTDRPAAPGGVGKPPVDRDGVGEPPVGRADGALAAGTVVGGYRIEYKLGAGGMGTVYAAEEPTIGKRVAIKVLRHAFAEDDGAALRFEREARAAVDVKHPGIVDVFAFGRLGDGRPYLVMSLLEGRSLREELAARGRFSAAEAWSLGREIAEALAAAHDAGVVHRDLKPDNVFLERVPGRGGVRLRPRVLDFGLAKLLAKPDDDDAPMKLTQSGVPMGTPAYMAPEQWWGTAIDARTDQYAFGALLFEMLAGRPPFRSQQYLELAQQHLHEAPPTLAELGVAVDEAVESFLRRALSKTADERFASMNDLLDAGDAAFGADAPGAAPSRDDPVAHAATVIAPGSEGGPRAGSPRAPSFGRDGSTIVRPLPGDDGVRRPRDATGAGGSAAESEALATAVPVSRPLERFLALHVGLTVAAFAAIVAAGYAGSIRHQVVEWFHYAGWGSIACAVWAGVGWLGLVYLAWRRSQRGTPSIAAWWLALWPGVSGAIGTYTGWQKVLLAVEEAPQTGKFLIWGEGMFEASASRFIGLWLSCILCLSLVAMAGLTNAWSVSKTLAVGWGVRPRESIAAGAGLAALTIIAVIMGAPSAALVSGVAAVALTIGLVVPTVHPTTAARDEMERALAGLCAVALAAAVGFARLEAREAALWVESPTRAARAAEIVAASGERLATLALSLASVVVYVGLETLRLRRLATRTGWPRPRRAASWLLIAVLSAIVVGDVTLHGRFQQGRDELRRVLDPQFALFAQLDPPSVGDELPPEKYAPRAAPALQIARDRIAIDGKGVAKLAALEQQRANIGRDLAHALAEPRAAPKPGEPPDEDAPDLAVSVDRLVPWGTVVAVLALAQGAGARRIDLLLTHGPRPTLPPGAPPETSYATVKDFVALPVELAVEGLGAPPEMPFGEVAPRLTAATLGGSGPVRIAVGR